jgi:hypothetical protein
VDSIGGNKYFVTFIDDFSRKLWSYLIQKKSEVIEVFSKFKFMVERQSSRKIKILRTDGGGEYVSKDFDALCVKEGIISMVRSMLKGKHLPKELWGETVSSATYILNRCPTKKL